MKFTVNWGTIPAGAAGSGGNGAGAWSSGLPVRRCRWRTPLAALPFGSDPDLMEQAVEAAQEADVIVAVLGGTSSRFGGGEFHNNGALKAQDMATMDCGENVDTSRLELPGRPAYPPGPAEGYGKAGGDRAHSAGGLMPRRR